jgi:hypothetical protein
VSRRSLQFPLYRQSQVFLQCQQSPPCLLFPAAISAFVELAPSSTT